MFMVLYANGAPEEIRTPDPQIRSFSRALCQGPARSALFFVAV
jgi:hypothetical protein